MTVNRSQLRVSVLLLAVALGGAALGLAQPQEAHALSPELPAGLNRVHPDEDVEYTLRTRFSLGEALAAVVHVRGALAGFEQLTYASRGKLPAAKVAQIGYTEPEMQTIGFRNLPGTIEGALRLQEWTIARLRYELAVERKKAAAASDQDVLAAKQAFEAADATFRQFWSTFGVAD
jgi:hypothetical protein